MVAVGTLPSRHTVKRRLNDKAVGVDRELTSDVKKEISGNRIVGITTGMWKDEKKQKFCFSHCVFYFE